MPFEDCIGLWFPDKGSESAKARESNQMDLNTRGIVVVIHFLLLFSILRLMVGVENSY